MINFLIVTHGEFGAYLVEAAESIVGAQERGVQCVGISPRTPLPEARARIARAVKELSGDDGLVVFTDMPGGTPGNLAFPFIKDVPRATLVSGVNLYMLVTAFGRRDGTGLDELLAQAVSAGQRSICDIRQTLAVKGR